MRVIPYPAFPILKYATPAIQDRQHRVIIYRKITLMFMVENTSHKIGSVSKHLAKGKKKRKEDLLYSYCSTKE